MSINLYDKLRSAFGSPIVDGDEVSIDRASLSTVQGDTSQDMANELERLFGIVRQIQNDRSNEQRPLNTFSGTTTVDGTNIGNFINRNSLYVRSDDARVTFTLPTDAVITTANQFPALIELSHFGGTARFDSGISPTNTVVIRPPSGEQLRRDSSTGTLLSFAELHRGDTAVITKQDASSPWVIVESSTDPRSSILPNGVFQLNTRTVTFPTNVNGDHIVGGLSLYTPTQGDAFEVSGSGIDITSTFGRKIETGDVIVAKIDDPSLVLTSSNDDWLIIRDAGHGVLTLPEIRFLNQITEVDSFSYSRLFSHSQVSATRIFASPYVLDHAPFINPSTDPDNPQSGETTEYIGGDEADDANFAFNPNQTQMNALTGTTGGTLAPVTLLYVDIDGAFNVNDNINDIFIEYKDRDGTVINRFSLANDFRGVTLTGSTDTYYVFDDVGATDNFSSINYHIGQTLDVVLRSTNRQFNLSSSVNILSAIQDGTIDISKLDVNTQALIRSNTGIDAIDQAKLDGLQLTTTSLDIPDHTNFYLKIDRASSTNDISHYQEISQLNGIIPDYERTTDIFILVPRNIVLTGLEKVESPTTKLSVVTVGEIDTTDGRAWIAYTATLPAITGANSVLDNAWVLDGTVQNSELSGAQDSFKVHVGNLAQDVLDRISGGGGTTPSTYTLPPNLESLSNDLTVNTRTETGWRALSSPIRATLTRQFSALWTENRRSFTGNFFDDITPSIDIIGFGANTVFYYTDANDPLNRTFPGAQSYIYSDNIRFRNTSPNTTPITNNYNKVIGFDYALLRTLGTNDNADMVKIGSTSTPLMGIAEDEGLYLNVGRNDGSQVSRTYTEPFQVDNNQWSTRVGQSVNTDSEVIIPDNLSGSLTVRVGIRLFDNDIDEGIHYESITITNLGSDQNFGNKTFSYTGFSDLVVTIRYDAVNNDLSTARRVLFIETTTALSNAAIHYAITADRSITETWNHPTTYARYPINAGDGHDDFGLFDPHLWNTEHVEERNRVVFVIEKWEDTDTSSDPEVCVRVVVDGELEASGNKIRLHRPASDFAFNDISFGNSLCAISHIQCYDYTASLPPSGTELLTLYNAQDRWFGAFTNDDFRTDAFLFGADIELAQGEFFILRSSNTKRWRISVSDTGALTTTELT